MQRATKESGLLNSQDIDSEVEDSLDEEDEETVADDAKKGSILIRLVNQAKSKEQKYIEHMKVFEVVDRKDAIGSQMNRIGWVVTNKGTPEKANARARWVAQEFNWIRSDSWTGTGDGRTRSRCSGWEIMAVFDVRRAYRHFFYDVDRTRCCAAFHLRGDTDCKVVAA